MRKTGCDGNEKVRASDQNLIPLHRLMTCSG